MSDAAHPPATIERCVRTVVRSRRLVKLCAAAMALALGVSGCATAAGPAVTAASVTPVRSRISDEKVRAELLAFADTGTTRVNQLCDEIVRQADQALARVRAAGPSPAELADAVAANIRIRSRANIEKLSIANLCMENAANPEPMTGLMDMTFAFTMKARNADRRVERLNRAATTPTTAPVQGDALDPWASDFVAVYKRCNDDLWLIAEKALAPEEIAGLAHMIEDFLADNPDLRYASAKAIELQKYVGKDPDNNRAFSLVNLKPTNEQVDRALWTAVRMPDLFRLEAKQAMFDAAKELALLRDDVMIQVDAAIDRASDKISSERRSAIEQASDAVSDERAKAIEHATITAEKVIDRLVDRFLLWVLLPAAITAIAFLALAIYAVRTWLPPRRRRRGRQTAVLAIRE